MDLKRKPIERNVVCYFCNEFFEEKYLQDHIIQCSSVLEPCPKKCGVYVQRSTKEKHILECRYKKPRTKSTHDLLEINNYLPSQSSFKSIDKDLETEIVSLRLMITEEKKYRLELQMELQRLYKSVKKSDEFNKQLYISFENLKKSTFEETEKRKTNTVDVEKVHLQHQIIDGWKKQLDLNLDHMKIHQTENDNRIIDIEHALKKLEKSSSINDRLEMEINMLHQKINDEQFIRQEEAFSIRNELNQLKDYFVQENALIAAVWNDQQEEIANLRKSNEIETNEIMDIKTKYQSLIFDVKSVSQIANESSEQLDSQSKVLKNLEDSLEQLKINIKTLQETIDLNNISSLPTGRLLWKINNFEEKMSSAKEHNTVIHSPAFLSSSYGYKIRLEMYLNGIKKWRGRYIILSLQILKGEWDPLLTWPCNIEAKIILRDQNQKGKNLVKHIAAKRISGDEENEEPQESSSQYIFVTHATLEKQDFIKNNLMFFEVIIINDNNVHTKHKTKNTDI